VSESTVSLAGVLEQVVAQRNRALDEAAQWAAKSNELTAELEQLRKEVDRLRAELDRLQRADGDGVSGSDA